MADEPQEHEDISDGAMDAVRALLTVADAYGIGVTFEPDSQGWRVGYIRGMGGGIWPAATTWRLPPRRPSGRSTSWHTVWPATGALSRGLGQPSPRRCSKLIVLRNR
jgi:hypothetical protein